MPVYWSMLAVTIVIAFISYGTTKKNILVDGKIVRKTKYIYALLTFFYIVFWVGLRDKVLDTGAYIKMFNSIPVDWEEMFLTISRIDSGKGFFFIQGIFKRFVSDNHYVWLSFMAIISCGCLLRILYKYSIDFPLTAYLFIADATFTWLLNGTRQFLVVTILFSFTDWLIEGKKWRYILLVLVLSTIHASAIFLVPVCVFVSSDKIFDKKMLLFLTLTIVGTGYSESIFGFIDEALETNYAESISEGAGSSIVRLFVAAIPLMIALLSRRLVEKKADKFIKLAINMSVVGVCFYFASTFTDGILIGRMPIYFTVYNLYLLPWLIHNCFEPRSRKVVWLGCVLAYGVYFYYQMEVAWGGLMYQSDILNVHW